MVEKYRVFGKIAETIIFKVEENESFSQITDYFLRNCFSE